MARLLLIDDDDTTREVLSVLLSADGWDVTEAASGDAALAVAGALQADVVLCDLKMPGVCGSELAETLRRVVGGGPRLVAMTATRLAGAPSGYDALLVKPFNAADARDALACVAAGAEDDEADVPALSGETFAAMRAAMPEQQLRALYEFALVDAERRVHAMRSAPDTATLRAEAHALKGACGMIGALRLRALAAAAEEHGVAEASMQSRMFLEFDVALSAVRRMLEELFASGASATPSP